MRRNRYERSKKAVEDKLAAEEIEVKKTVRKAARKAKEAVENAAKSDEAVAAQIEVKKRFRSRLMLNWPSIPGRL